MEDIQNDARACYIFLTLAAQLTFHTWLGCPNTLQLCLTVVIGSFRFLLLCFPKSSCYFCFRIQWCGTTECSKIFKLLSPFFPQKHSLWEYYGSGWEFSMIDMEKLCIQYIINCEGDFLVVEKMKDNYLNVTYTYFGASLGVSLYWYWPLELCHYCCLVF